VGLNAILIPPDLLRVFIPKQIFPDHPVVYSVLDINKLVFDVVCEGPVMIDLKTTLDAHPPNRWVYIVRSHIGWMQFLQDQYPNATDLKERLFLFANHLAQSPKCAVDDCHNLAAWHNNHYSQCCGRSCAQLLKKKSGALKIIQEKTKQTNLAKYGHENPLSNPDTQRKRVQTVLNKYGAGNSPKARQASQDRMIKINQNLTNTLMEKYGFPYTQQVPAFREKTQKTLQEKYKVNSVGAIPQVLAHRQQERIEDWQKLSGTVTILCLHNPTKPLPFANKQVEFQCLQCQCIDTIPSETFKYRSRNFQTPCKQCSGISCGSREETQVFDWINSLGLQITRHDRVQIAPYELDIWLPQQRIAIEYCGLYWHSEENGKSKTYHNNKTLMCQKQNIRLIQIFQDEWLYNQDVVKNRLRYILGANAQHRLYARKCQLVTATSSEAREFMNANHIQGFSPSKVHLALAHDNIIVSIMSFSGLNIAKGLHSQADHWEITRFASSSSVVGGASKLFRAFVEKYNPISVISYSDRRWNTGAVYEKIGMSYVSCSAPNYWYVRSDRREHRFRYRKDQLVKSGHDPDMTEKEIMKSQGYLRIWDCGHDKWIWSKK
jgi:hypothetical protein